ncbi:MAG: SDR family NAD(P)-dependent oxidoreductase [Actinobacteria bacterium]|nr:SDR family NAD(P)-dependent oxidoreductase [Actinomycetota bacterium]
MVDQVVLITGSTSGIGLAAAHAVAAAGDPVVLHGRRPDRVADAAARLTAEGLPVAAALTADLGDRAAVEQLAAEASALGVGVLVNNAGVYRRERTETAAGREVTWTVNHLHPTLLTVLLLDDLLDRGGRVVNTSAVVHGRARLDLDDPEFRTRRYNHFHAYANSKLANLLMAREFARRVGPDSGVTFNALHPGVVSTALLTEGMRVEGHDPAEVAGAAVARLAVGAEVAGVTGCYFEGEVETEPSGPGLDDELARRLHDDTMRDLGFD